MRNIALIGFGAIGASVVDLWPTLSNRSHLGALLVRPYQLAEARARAPKETFVTDEPDAFLAKDADIVVEAAGHGAVAALGEKVLAQGRDFHILSVGALADPGLRSTLAATAAAHGSRIVVLAGALAGFDGLVSMRAGEIQSVRYISTKPFSAWRGTPAEALLPAAEQGEPVVVFRGSAAQVCRLFPKNANLAAAVAIAGIGFERTEVELVADPTITDNIGHLHATADSGELDVRLVGAGFAANPKSSRITALSVIGALHDLCEPVAFR
ncbi:aspartate dehydrogenase [Sphingomonas sp.]|uniref:aspartate dehydrogenase n=1 Tax=Sphingomonas sp. TaxID=28214 RepID=UPI0026008215|nr:aspartate dehydrogenase [Sphingomonas sp.]